MSTFRIAGSRRSAEKDIVEFFVETRSVGPSVCEEFRCWDTHHPADYVILEVQREAETCILRCRGWLGFDGLFEGAVIDTDYKIRGPGFHYERTKENA